MIEVHPDPEKALSDGPQSLTFDMVERLLRDLGRDRARGREAARTVP